MVVKRAGPHSQIRYKVSLGTCHSFRLLNLSVLQVFLNKMMVRIRMKERAYCIVMPSTKQGSINCSHLW